MITFPFPQMMGEPLSKQQQGQRPRSRWDLRAATWWGRFRRGGGRQGPRTGLPRADGSPAVHTWSSWGGEDSRRELGEDLGSSVGTSLGGPGLGSLCKRDLDLQPAMGAWATPERRGP